MSVVCKSCKNILGLSDLEMIEDETSLDIFCSKCQISNQDNRKRVDNSFTSTLSSTSTTTARSSSMENRSHHKNDRREEIEKKRVTFQANSQEDIDPFAFPSEHIVEDVSAEQEARRLEFIEAQKRLFQQQELEVPVVRSLSKSAERAAVDLIIDESTKPMKENTQISSDLDDIQDEVSVDPFAFSAEHTVDDVSEEQEAKRIEFIEAQKRLFQQQEEEMPLVRSLTKSIDCPSVDLIIDESPQVSCKDLPQLLETSSISQPSVLLTETIIADSLKDYLPSHEVDTDPFAFSAEHTVEDVSEEQEAKRIEFIEAQKRLFQQQEGEIPSVRAISKSSSHSLDDLTRALSQADLIIDSSPNHSARGSEPPAGHISLPVSLPDHPITFPTETNDSTGVQEESNNYHEKEKQGQQWMRESWFDASKWASSPEVSANSHILAVSEVNEVRPSQTIVPVEPLITAISTPAIMPTIEVIPTDMQVSVPASASAPVENTIDPSFAWPEALAEPSLSKHSSLSSTEWPGTIKTPKEIAEAERVAAELRAWEEQADRELEAEARRNEQLEQELRLWREKQSESPTPLLSETNASISATASANTKDDPRESRLTSTGSHSSAGNGILQSMVRPFSTGTSRSQNSLESDSMTSSAAQTPTKGKGVPLASCDDGIVHGSQLKLVPVSSFDDRREDSIMSPGQKKSKINKLLSTIFSSRKNPNS